MNKYLNDFLGIVTEGDDRKKIAISCGLAIERLEETDGKERYNYCPNCDLFLRGDLPKNDFGDMGNAPALCGSEGFEYYCPVCKDYNFRKYFTGAS